MYYVLRTMSYVLRTMYYYCLCYRYVAEALMLMPMSEATSRCQRVVMPRLLPDMRPISLMPFDTRLDREGELFKRAWLRGRGS